MGQILVIQDDGEIGSALSANHSVVQGVETSDLRPTLTAQVFQAAILAGEGVDESILATVRDADPDLTVLRVAAGTVESAAQSRFWEVLARPLHAGRLEAAVQRAIQHTRLMRENRTLRGQPSAGTPMSTSESSAATAGTSPNFDWITSLPARFDLRTLLSTIEKKVIVRMLDATHGAQAEAARRLGLSRSDLSYKLAKYELRRSSVLRIG